MTTAAWILTGLIVGTIAGLVNMYVENRRASSDQLRRELDWHQKADR